MDYKETILCWKNNKLTKEYRVHRIIKGSQGNGYLGCLNKLCLCFCLLFYLNGQSVDE